MDTTLDADGGGDGRWMTYREIAQARGIDVSSAVKLSRRQHWRRQAGNRNTVRVFVPLDWLSWDGESQSMDTTKDGEPETRDATTDIERLTDAFETAVSALRGQLAATQARADRLDLLVETERETFRGIIDRQAIDLTAAREQLQDAQTVAEQLRQAEAARKSRGRLARLRAAWRGE